MKLFPKIKYGKKVENLLSTVGNLPFTISNNSVQQADCVLLLYIDVGFFFIVGSSAKYKKEVLLLC